MRPREKIEKMIKQFDIDVNPKKDQEILDGLRQAQAKSKQSKPVFSVIDIWRIIMASKKTKFAIAVAVMLVVVLALTLMDKTVTPVYALEQSIEAMKNVSWMHAVPSSTMEGGETAFGETWFSVTHGIGANRCDDGTAGITYFNKDESYSYDPVAGTITLSLVSKADILSRTNSYSELFGNIIDTLNEHEGTEKTTISEVRNGKKAIVIEVKVPKGVEGDLGTEIWRFVMDEKSFLPMQMVLQGYNAEGEFIEVFDVLFDYPDTGPMDIYQLGVPSTAKIIDMRPSIDVQSIIEKYEAARKNDLSRYIALVLYTCSKDGGPEVAEEATIYYVDGNKFRREQLLATSDIIDSQRKGLLNLGPEMGDSLESTLNWWSNREHLAVRRAEMYDGEYKHHVVGNLNITEFQRHNKEVNTKWREKNNKPPNLNNMYTGGAQFLGRISNDVTKEQVITLVENEYSKQNGLICLQRLEEDRRFPFMRNGRRYKRLCYIDPERDYICRRMEEYFVQDELWKKMYSDADRCLVNNPDAGLEYTMLQVKEITESGQSEDGKWYPKRIEQLTTTQRGNGKLQKDISIFTIYLDTDGEFPEGIFDSKAFSNYLE